MILQSLDSYYERLQADEASGAPVLGFSRQKIHFALALDPAGELIQVADLRDAGGKKPVPRPMTVPFDPNVKRTVGVVSYFLWDNTKYVLGMDDKGKPERVRQCFEAFRELHHRLLDGVEDQGAKALLAFLDRWEPPLPQDLPDSFPSWEEIAGLNLVFQLDGERRFLHERTALRRAWLEHLAREGSGEQGMCLVTGKIGPVAKLHPAIKGVRGAQSSGASIVSFNLEAFRSYGKEQNQNAPVSEAAAFAYTTALNHLLSDSRRRIQIGDATTVFWSGRPTVMEDLLAGFLDPPGEDEGDSGAEDDSLVKDVRDFLSAVRDGKRPAVIQDEAGTPFYVLGLSPNASRLSVRFWYAGTVGEMAERLGRHFRDLSIVRQFDNDPEFPGVWRLLRETAALRKSDNVSPALAGAFARAILAGVPYPRSLLAAVMGRVRADGVVNHLRAALVKAVLVRRWRVLPNERLMEVGIMLDKQSPNVPYRLGRLFAMFEGIQRKAGQGRDLNVTIRDRFFTSASATPRAVFPRLFQLAQHHLKSVRQDRKGLAGYFDQQIGEILEPFEAETGFPAHLSLEEQGLFALGYYHQRAERKDKEQKEEEKEE